MKLTTRILFLIASLITAYTYADNNRSTLLLTLRNHTNETLSYAGVSEQNPDNTFLVAPAVIPPNTNATIVATSTFTEDLAGKLHFKNYTNADNVFLIVDYRKFKIGQPVFEFYKSAPQLTSTTTAKIINPDHNGRALMYSAATVEINEK